MPTCCMPINKLECIQKKKKITTINNQLSFIKSIKNIICFIRDNRVNKT